MATTERGPPNHPKTCAQNAHKLRHKRLKIPPLPIQQLARPPTCPNITLSMPKYNVTPDADYARKPDRARRTSVPANGMCTKLCCASVRAIDRLPGRACLCRRSYPLWPSIFQKRKHRRPKFIVTKARQKANPPPRFLASQLPPRFLLPGSRANVVARQPIMLC